MLNVCTVCKSEFESDLPAIGEEDLCPACYKQIFVDPMLDEDEEPLYFDPSIYETEVDFNFEDLEKSEFEQKKGVDMAWVATDYNGTEAVFTNEPERIIYGTDFLDNEWYDRHGMYVNLPSGSIEKLIGRKLTWEDEPVELN